MDTDPTSPAVQRLGHIFVALVFVCALLIASIGMTAMQSTAPRWEYRIEFHRDDAATGLPEWMNGLGADGWEAFSVRRASMSDPHDAPSQAGGGGAWGTEAILRRRR